jgi:hypothetical protein
MSETHGVALGPFAVPISHCLVVHNALMVICVKLITFKLLTCFWFSARFYALLNWLVKYVYMSNFLGKGASKVVRYCIYNKMLFLIL